MSRASQPETFRGTERAIGRSDRIQTSVALVAEFAQRGIAARLLDAAFDKTTSPSARSVNKSAARQKANFYP